MFKYMKELNLLSENNCKCIISTLRYLKDSLITARTKCQNLASITHIFQTMAMSNSERQRRFRARRDADTEKRKKYLQKGQERYKTECKSGKTKPIN